MSELARSLSGTEKSIRHRVSTPGQARRYIDGCKAAQCAASTEARINEAKIIVLQALQSSVFVQLEIAVGTITIELLRHADHGRRDIDAAAFRKIFGHSAGQSAHAATKVEGGRCFIDAKTNLGGVAKYCFNLFTACGEKLFSASIGYCVCWDRCILPTADRLGPTLPSFVAAL